MVSIDDKAEKADDEAYSIEDAAEAAGRFRVRSLELDPAEEVGTDQFPRFGDWLPVVRTIDGMDHGDCHVECPGGLARSLVEAEVEEGDVFAVETASKNRSGEWEVSVQVDG